jgi:hypothetical protein
MTPDTTLLFTARALDTASSSGRPGALGAS